MIDRRRFCAAAIATVAVRFTERTEAMTTVAQETSIDKTAIRPLRVNFSAADVADLRRRVKATKWPERETVNDASQGVQFATTQKLANYWATDYDWSKCEAKL